VSHGVLREFDLHDPPVGDDDAVVRDVSEIEMAWDEVRAANTMGWRVGTPSFHDEADRWEQYAYDPSERPASGTRSREWIAVAPTEVMCVREMARCLRELREGRWPR
jgi:hypothetical protein